MSAYLTKPIDDRALDAGIRLAASRHEEFRALEAEVEKAQQALEDRKLIEQAKGILMTAAGIPEPEAFRRIQRAARDRNLKLVDVARRILEQRALLERVFRAGGMNVRSSAKGFDAPPQALHHQPPAGDAAHHAVPAVAGVDVEPAPASRRSAAGDRGDRVEAALDRHAARPSSHTSAQNGDEARERGRAGWVEHLVGEVGLAHRVVAGVQGSCPEPRSARRRRAAPAASARRCPRRRPAAPTAAPRARPGARPCGAGTSSPAADPRLPATAPDIGPQAITQARVEMVPRSVRTSRSAPFRTVC